MWLGQAEFGAQRRGQSSSGAERGRAVFAPSPGQTPGPCDSRCPRRKPDIPVPYLYVDMGVAVLCASFMSFGVKRRWFALGAALQLAVATYAAHVGGHVHYGDWLKVRPPGPSREPPGTLRAVLTGAAPPAGPDVLAHHRHHRRIPDPGQRRRGALPAKTAQPLPAVHGTGVPGHLPHLPGEGLGTARGQPGDSQGTAR